MNPLVIIISDNIITLSQTIFGSNNTSYKVYPINSYTPPNFSIVFLHLSIPYNNVSVPKLISKYGGPPL